MRHRVNTDFAVIGSGVAGLTFALLASRHGRVALLTKTGLGAGNSDLAQGGMAAAVAPDDHASLHKEDTLHTGQGLCNAKTVAAVIEGGADAVAFLTELGVQLDHDENGVLKLGKEGAHSRHRIVHAGGDATGHAIVSALLSHVRQNPRIEIFENTYVADLWMEGDVCAGLFALGPIGEILQLRSRAVVLATGGLGQLYQFSTNAVESTGDGHVLAYRAGARLRDMEFIQFHPTALLSNKKPQPLVSEAVRGEGARLVNSDGEYFMSRYHPWKDLAARDVVARSIYQEMQKGQDVYLDARGITAFSSRFPTIYATLQSIGIEPSRDLIPVVPVAHYAMGGVETDTDGATSITRLLAVGEVTSSGLHGANRLASNSLLEGLVMAKHAVALAASFEPLPQAKTEPDVTPYVHMTKAIDPSLLQKVQELMWTHAGIVRDGYSLLQAEKALEDWLQALPADPSADRSLLTAALLVTRGALWREESRGAHYRSDYPEPSPRFLNHSIQGDSHESVAYSPVS